MTGWTDWSDWSGDWSDWGSDYAYMSLLTGAERGMLYEPYEPPEQHPYPAKTIRPWYDTIGNLLSVEVFEVTAGRVFGNVKELFGFSWDDLRAGIPALTVVSAISGIGAGVRYHEKMGQYEAKVKALEDRRRRIEQMVREGEEAGKIVREGDKLVVSDEKLYRRLKSEEEKYDRMYEETKRLEEELKSMEREITPPFSAKDYPVVGKRLYEFEKSAFDWFREKTKPYGAAGEFAAGLGMGIVGLVEFPAFLASLTTKPQTIGASMTVHALERPAEFAGTMVGALVGGKMLGSAVGRGAGVVGRGVETVRAALTEPRPVKQTIIIGDEIVY